MLTPQEWLKSNIKIKMETPFGKHTAMIATIDSPHTFLTGPPGLIKVNKEGVLMTVLENCGPFGLWI